MEMFDVSVLVEGEIYTMFVNVDCIHNYVVEIGQLGLKCGDEIEYYQVTEKSMNKTKNLLYNYITNRYIKS